MNKSNWNIRKVSEETQRIVRTHAAYRGISSAEMLEIIVSEWSQSNEITIVQTPKED